MTKPWTRGCETNTQMFNIENITGILRLSTGVEGMETLAVFMKTHVGVSAQESPGIHVTTHRYLLILSAERTCEA